MMVVKSLQPREGRNGSDEVGDGKADVDVGVMVVSGQRCAMGRGRMGR